MNVWQFALFCGAAIVAVVNYNQSRVFLWIGLAALNFVATAIYQGNAVWWIPHPFVTGVVDSILVILIDIYRRERWERLVQFCFMVSVLISIARLMGWVESQYAYVVGLELCNWGALIVMGGHGILNWHADERYSDGVVGQAARARPPGAVHSLRAFLDAPSRSKNAFARKR